ncbi:MAG TPA: hypothetical protein VHB21_25170 [Minicystis sp.]|nr:hypothetical protein [Minicystis sp.]
MKATGTCPKCGNRYIYVINPVRHSLEGWHGADTVPVIATRLRGHPDVVAGGTHALYICAACGYEEWYAERFQELLETLRSVPESGVSIVGEQHGAYR